MKTLFALVLLTGCLSSVPAAVVVRLGNFDFPLQDVIQLKTLMDDDLFKKSRFSFAATAALCNSPDVPEMFIPVCTKSDAPHVFFLLRQIAAYPYPCEICAYASCIGCS
ncbi:guanylin-like [Heptranchias perlo]|uniref:guanylin-like n=1 Tax=Heptranchias perlo TaxID=212740 RepID=UPI00355A711D